jgi:hypothetical protein
MVRGQQVPTSQDMARTLWGLGETLAPAIPLFAAAKAVPTLAKQVYSAATLPGDVYAGRVDPTSDEAIRRSMDLATSAPMAALPAAEEHALGVFGGRVAANRIAEQGITGPKAALDLAERLDAEGASREEIYAATNKLLEGTPYAGASRGADGKWRFEIDDRSLSVRSGAGGIGNIGEQYSHPELFSAYPRIPNEWSRLSISPRARMSGGYQSDFGIMDVSAPSAEEARTVAAHELQHAVQSREGFSRGSNASGGFLRGFVTPFSAAARKRAWERYHTNPGEVEARNVEHRLSMSPEQRRATPPWQTTDVPTEEQNVPSSLGDILSNAVSGSRLTPQQANAWRSGDLL